MGYQHGVRGVRIDRIPQAFSSSQLESVQEGKRSMGPIRLVAHETLPRLIQYTSAFLLLANCGFGKRLHYELRCHKKDSDVAGFHGQRLSGYRREFDDWYYEQWRGYMHSVAMRVDEAEN